MHTDACKTQIGAVMSQNGKTIAFHSRKMNGAQQNYAVTEKELLSIVATLKEFGNILLGQQIKVFADHRNLAYKNLNTERVMRWRPVLVEFGPDLQCIEGKRNVVADQKYGELPAKQAEKNPLDTLRLDLTGPHKIERKGKKDLKPWCPTMINPATGWFEMEQISNKTAAKAADICEATWFT
jgi:hypothetical protein